MIVVPRSRLSSAICAADADRHVGIEPERRLVEEEHFRLVQQGLGEGQPLLEARRQLVVLGPPVGPELGTLDQLLDPAAEHRTRQSVQPPVKAQHLGGTQAPHEGRIAARHVQAPANGERIPDDVVAQHRRRSRVGQEQRREDGQERGLPGAVRPEQAEDRAPRHLEARAAQSFGAPLPEPPTPERLHEIARIDGEHDESIVTRSLFAHSGAIW